VTDDIYVTINDIKNVHEMNAGQLNIDVEDREQMTTDDPPTIHTIWDQGLQNETAGIT